VSIARARARGTGVGNEGELVVTRTTGRRAKSNGAAPNPGASSPETTVPDASGSAAPTATASKSPRKRRIGVKDTECNLLSGQTVLATEQERNVLARQQTRAPDVALPPIALKFEGDEPRFVPQYVDEAIGWQVLMDAFATTNRRFVEGLLEQMLYVTDNTIAEKQLNFLVSIVAGLKPRDEGEAILATNISVSQMWTMRLAERLGNTSGAIQDEMFVGMYTKLARTLTAQFEALKRYRTGGEQKIVVQHTQNVSVEGQAIVGNVTHMKGKSEEAPAQRAATPLALPNVTHEPMPIIDVPVPDAVPVPARRRRKASK
jgi:hypothetical protein